MRTVVLVLLALAAPVNAQTLLIGSKGEDTVSFLDRKSGRELNRLPADMNGVGLAISPITIGAQ